MRRVRTIALELRDEHVEILDRLARRHGSPSRAIERLLEEAERTDVYRELDEAYDEYLKAPGREASRALTEELLSAASWPPGWLRGEKREKRQARPRSSRPR